MGKALNNDLSAQTAKPRKSPKKKLESGKSAIRSWRMSHTSGFFDARITSARDTSNSFNVSHRGDKKTSARNKFVQSSGQKLLNVSLKNNEVHEINQSLGSSRVQSAYRSSVTSLPT